MIVDTVYITENTPYSVMSQVCKNTGGFLDVGVTSSGVRMQLQAKGDDVVYLRAMDEAGDPWGTKLTGRAGYCEKFDETDFKCGLVLSCIRFEAISGRHQYVRITFNEKSFKIEMERF